MNTTHKFLLPVFTTAFLVIMIFSCKSKQTADSGNNTANTGSTGGKGTIENYDTPANITEGLNIGNKAPELAFNSPTDSVISLSSLRGYYVLIDFWASWCGPCRYENPNVVKAHKRFSKEKFSYGKGFKVFNVSLDNNKAAWQNAIRKDSLNWPYHISDLKGWDTQLGAKYQVNSIPANWLIDPRGIIVAKGLRGEALHTALERFLDTTKVAEPKGKKK